MREYFLNKYSFIVPRTLKDKIDLVKYLELCSLEDEYDDIVSELNKFKRDVHYKMKIKKKYER